MTLFPGGPGAAGVAREHGSQRYRVGFDLRVVVIEYDLLREVIHEHLDEADLVVHASDIRVIATAFAVGIAEAVDQYSLERERDLLASVAARERASEFERQLIGIVSHDLRTPLASILMAAEQATRNGRADPLTARQLERIRTAAQRATRLINDLLDFTRERNAGHIPVQARSCCLRELVTQAIEDAESMFPGRAIRYSDHHEQPEIFWDPDRITQVLSNLLTNALKFSPPTSAVTVTTRIEGEGAVLAIHNEGPAIPGERQATLFEPFQRGDPNARARASLGLGLYIARQIARAHGGEIEVRSVDGEGTTFTVRLPLRAPEARP